MLLECTRPRSRLCSVRLDVGDLRVPCYLRTSAASGTRLGRSHAPTGSAWPPSSVPGGLNVAGALPFMWWYRSGSPGSRPLPLLAPGYPEDSGPSPLACRSRPATEHQCSARAKGCHCCAATVYASARLTVRQKSGENALHAGLFARCAMPCTRVQRPAATGLAAWHDFCYTSPCRAPLAQYLLGRADTLARFMPRNAPCVLAWGLLSARWHGLC